MIEQNKEYETVADSKPGKLTSLFLFISLLILVSCIIFSYFFLPSSEMILSAKNDCVFNTKNTSLKNDCTYVKFTNHPEFKATINSLHKLSSYLVIHGKMNVVSNFTLEEGKLKRYEF